MHLRVRLSLSHFSSSHRLSIDFIVEPKLANSGFFEQAILAQKELMGPTSSTDATSTPEIVDAFWEGEDEQTHGRSETKGSFLISFPFINSFVDWGRIYSDCEWALSYF